MRKSTRHKYRSAYLSARDARRDLIEFARGCHIVDEDINDVVLATGEAVNNAVEHGHTANARFSVKAACEDGNLSVEIEDAGKGFELAGKGERMRPEDRGARGLGIFIMRSLMDEVSYSITRSGTCVRLSKTVRVDDPTRVTNPTGSPRVLVLNGSGDSAKPGLESFRRHLGRGS